MVRTFSVWSTASLLALSSCAGDALEKSFVVTIDTELPTPEIAARTRIDLYTDNGTWFDSRDIDTRAPASFPLSFGVKKGVVVRVRVRIYPSGHVRPYEGERFVDWPRVLDRTAADAPSTDAAKSPRLVDASGDRTPETEPVPATTVDRLVRIDSGTAESAHIRLYGACAGHMANLATGESCERDGNVRKPLSAPPATADKAVTILRESCEAKASSDSHVCIPGGVFVMGDRTDEIDFPKEEFLSVVSERLVRVRTFWIDRQEITVGRYRAAIARGFRPEEVEPAENDGPFKPTPTAATACTYSKAPRGREDYALSCASWVTLRALCQFEGGDLPTEAQWEYVARAAGGAAERRFPWGSDDPACDMALFGRTSGTGCPKEPWPGELAVVDSSGTPSFETDRTILGVYGLAGSLSEFVLDTVAEYTDTCWTTSPWDNAGCAGPFPTPKEATDPALRRVARGGSWIAPPGFVRGTVRIKASLASPFYGARCAYATQP